jgi:hypothetical protein
MRRSWLPPLLAAALSCNGTTGYDLVQFYAAGRGFSDAVKGQPYTFFTGAGVRVTLTQASLHVGALYLTQSVPQAGGGPQPCSLPQTYEGAFVGEVRGEGDIDLLDPSVQQIPVVGDGSTIPAVTGQVWLTHDASISQGNLNGPDDMPILTLEGSFEDAAGGTHTFSAGITIDLARISGAPNSGLPGEIQICQQRIVSGIAVDLTLAQGGTLVLGVDAQPLFNGVSFTDLPTAASLVEDAASACLTGVPSERCFTNDANNVSSTILFTNLKTTGPFRFAWVAAAP